MNERYPNEDGTVEWVALDYGEVPVKSITTDVARNEVSLNWEQLSTDYAKQPVTA